MAKKYSDLTETEKEVVRARAKEFSKRKHAERAFVEGRAPGVVGAPRRFSDAERAARKLLAQARYREKHAARILPEAAERAFRKRHEQAAAEGREIRPPGKHLRPQLSEDEKRERRRAARRNYVRRKPEIGRAYYVAHQDHLCGVAKQHKQRLKTEHPEKFRAQNLAQHNNRRARKLKTGGKFNAADVQWLWNQQRGKCVFCLKPLVWKKFQVDHHLPLARGGSNDRKNLRLLHKKCNLQKSWRDPFQHALEYGMLCW